MKSRGFTLIELLAVIVILGIIALIITPIIVNMISDARLDADKRSIELYASSIRNAMASYQLKEDKHPTSMEQVRKYLTYDGTPVICEIEEIYDNGKVYLAECSINGKLIDYEYET